MAQVKKEVILLFDALRDPRDMAQMIHLAIASKTRIELTGNSIAPNHPKVVNILNSWMPGFSQKQDFSMVSNKGDYFSRIKQLKKKGYTMLGTSSVFGNSLYSTDLSKGKHAIVFGTETSGLSKEKVGVLDGVVRVPMKLPAKFFTISAIAPAILLESMRQKKLI